MALLQGLANFGLMQQGMNQGEEQRNQLALQGQKVASGQLGLEEQQRDAADMAEVRQVAAAAAQGGKGLTGSFMDMSAAAAKRGRPDLAMFYRKSADDLYNQGVPQLIHQVFTNEKTGERPDLLPAVNGVDRWRDVNRVEYQGNGVVLAYRPGKTEPEPIKLGGLAVLLGLTKPVSHVVAGGSSLVTQNLGPWGGPTSVYQAPKMETISPGAIGSMVGTGYGDPRLPENQIKAPSAAAERSPETDVFKVVEKDSEGNEHTYGWNVRTQNWEGGRAPPSSDGGPPSGVNVRKDLSVLNDITKGIADLGEEYGKTDMSDVLNPRVKLTPKGQEVARIAEQVRLANQNLAPRTIIDIAVKGKRGFVTVGGQQKRALQYDGKTFLVDSPTGYTPPPQAAAAQGSPASAAPATVPQPAMPAPVAAPTPVGAPVTNAPAQIPAMSATATGSATQGGRKFEPELEAKDPTLKRIGNLVRMKVGDPNLDFQYWMSYVARAKQLGSRNYAKGGKVQRHGL
jgi:hypothetical protein